MTHRYISTFLFLSILLLSTNFSTAQVNHEVCEVVQITDAPEDSRDPFVCANGGGMIINSRADLANNGHAEQEDLFFVDITDPFNPIFYQLTNTSQNERGASINADCTEITFGSRSDLTGGNPSNFDQLFYGDISNPNNPIYIQLTNNMANNKSVSPRIVPLGSKIAFGTGLDITGMNPDESFEYFVFDNDNIGFPFTQLTNSPAGGGIFSGPVTSLNGNRVAFSASSNYIPPNQNIAGGRQVYLSDIIYDAPNPPIHTLYQITQANPGSITQGAELSGDGQRLAFVTDSDLTGMNPGQTRQFFIANINNPGNPDIVQITNSDEFIASRGLLSETGLLLAFETDNPDFTPRGDDDTDTIVITDISNEFNPEFTSITDFPLGSDLDDLSATRDFSVLAFESDSPIISGGSTDGNDEVYIIFPNNCGAIGVPTLSEWGLIAMAGVLGIVGFMVARRRKVTA